MSVSEEMYVTGGVVVVEDLRLAGRGGGDVDVGSVSVVAAEVESILEILSDEPLLLSDRGVMDGVGCDYWIMAWSWA